MHGRREEPVGLTPWGLRKTTPRWQPSAALLSRGLTWVDTAGVYGLGHSEEVVAKALKDIPDPDRPFVFTKCGLVWDTNDPYLPARRVGAAGSIRSDCEDSLRRLQVEVIDLLQMHWPADDGSRLEDYWGILLQLKEEGKNPICGTE